VLTKEFHYELPPELIAQEPVTPRDHSRLFIVNAKRKTQNIKYEHLHFYDIENELSHGDVLVFNDSKVFPARLRGQKETGGRIEVLLLEEQAPDTWTALLKPGKGSEGMTIAFAESLTAKVSGRDEEVFTLQFNHSGNELAKLIDDIGEAPTPPYIKQAPKDLQKYQTIYADKRGSVAAPTAGFHFTEGLMKKLEAKGVQFEYVTLHVGLGTFQPVKETEAEKHQMHSERYSVDPDTWQRISRAKGEGRRIIPVGTTSCRLLETLAANPDTLSGMTDLYILPGYKFRFIDSLITNFHLPNSTLLMLVAAFLGTKLKDPEQGIKLIKKIYTEAVAKKYSFYSFGDAMFIE